MPAVPLLALAYVGGSLLTSLAGGPWLLSLALAALTVIALRLHRLGPSLLVGVAVVLLRGSRPRARRPRGGGLDRGTSRPARPS